jgi:hypothetical protein
MEHHQEKSNMHYGFPRKKKRKKGTRRLFKEIIAESVTNLERDMSAHIHEAQRFPNRLNKNIYTMSLSKESFESNKKVIFHIQGSLHGIISDFLSRNSAGQEYFTHERCISEMKER